MPIFSITSSSRQQQWLRSNPAPLTRWLLMSELLRQLPGFKLLVFMITNLPHDNANPTASQLTKMTEDLHRDITERLRCLELQIRITSHMFIGVAQTVGDDPTNLVKVKDEMLAGDEK
ncbi:hypothetical protein QC763_0094830 [Podospora pseudopauciseta]|uniref:Uncharacterized protein n=1 Tax=Podospora pseudopauciseta TaxID=2093780 RepID=A0ABR0H4Z9_9PEZI|nr:hypothetical protein QC763_0094830 [Podospora pseudopauciseta]